jgi:hypothetical protein
MGIGTYRLLYLINIKKMIKYFRKSLILELYVDNTKIKHIYIVT